MSFNDLQKAYQFVSGEMLYFNDVDSERYMYLESELAKIEAQIDEYCVGGEMDLDSYCELQQTPPQYREPCDSVIDYQYWLEY